MRRVTADSRSRSAFVSPASAFVGDLDEPKRKTNPKKALARAREELEEILSASEWHRAQPRHFVALYVKLHEHVYKVPPYELESDAFFGATSAAARMMRDDFASSPERMMHYVRWTWQRERQVEKRRQADGQDGRRIGWQLQFVTRHLLTDYRRAAVSAAATATNGKGHR